MNQSGFYGWKLLATFWVVMFINLAFPAYGSSVINAAMLADLHLDRQTLGWVFSTYMIMSGLPGPLVAVSINRYGVRTTLIIGSALVIAGSLFMALVAHNGLQAAFGFGLLVGSGVATGAALASQSGLAQWFVRRRALALSILYSAGAIGGFVAAPLLNRVITAAGGNWRVGWWMIACLSTLAAIIAALFVRERPADLGQHADGDAPDGTAGGVRHQRPPWVSTVNWSYGEAVRSVPFWMLLLAITGGSGGYTLFLAHGVVHLQDLGHTRTAAAWAVSILTISGLFAKVIIAALGDRLDPRYLWGIFTLVFGLGLVIVVDARSTLSLFAFAACLGIGFGGGLVCMMAVLSNYYGVKAFPGLSGLAIAFNTSMSSIAPIIAGRLYDRGFGYASSFYATAALCMAGGIMLLLMRRPTRDERAPG
jgi:MFS family permease